MMSDCENVVGGGRQQKARGESTDDASRFKNNSLKRKTHDSKAATTGSKHGQNCSNMFENLGKSRLGRAWARVDSKIRCRKNKLHEKHVDSPDVPDSLDSAPEFAGEWGETLGGHSYVPVLLHSCTVVLFYCCMLVGALELKLNRGTVGNRRHCMQS